MRSKIENYIIKHKSVLQKLLCQLIIGMLGAFIVVGLLNQFRTQKIATVNITGLESSFIKETTQQGLDQVQMKEKATQFVKLLDLTLVRLAHRYNLVILPSEAVVAGKSVDYTSYVANQIKAGLRK